MKKPFFLLTFFIAFIQICSAQGDSIRIFGRDKLVRGIYKTYEEFVSNAPSIREEFTIEAIPYSKEDSSVIGAKFHLKDSSKKMKNFWGFCDGSSVFVWYRLPTVL